MALGINAPPRTLKRCADEGLALRIVCKTCGAITRIAAADVCRAFGDWTIEALQRAGALGCGACREPSSLAVVGTFWGAPSDFETWPAKGAGWTRAPADGMSG